MYPEAEALKYLLYSDGSTRDVTFTPCRLAAVLEFMDALRSAFAPVSLTDNEGIERTIELSSEHPLSLFADSRGSLHGIWESESGLFRRLQTFIDWDTESSPDLGVEISFFPDELNSQVFSLRSFHEQVEAWRILLGAEDFFVRQENASWEPYDAGGLGVIYTHRRLPLWR